MSMSDQSKVNRDFSLIAILVCLVVLICLSWSVGFWIGVIFTATVALVIMAAAASVAIEASRDMKEPKE